MRSTVTLRALAIATLILVTACGDGDPTGTGTTGSIHGTVTDDTGASVANAAVALSGNGESERSTQSDADGAYAFEDVSPGTYTLAIVPPAGFVIGAAATRFVTVASGVEASPPAFVLARAPGSIRGTVTDDTGATVASATVTLSGNAQPARTAVSAADGVYTFADVPPGTYTLAIAPPSGFTLGQDGTTSLVVASGVQANASAFVLERVLYGSVTGTVTDTSGAGLAGVPIGLIGIGQPLRTTQTGASGVFTFMDVPAGSYTLVVAALPGYSISQGTVPVTVVSETQTTLDAFVLQRLTPEQADSAFVAAVGAYLQFATASDAFSGAVLVARGGTIVFEGAYGLANRAQGVPNTLLTKFRVGSMNKMMTAVATLQLAAAGDLNLNDPFGSYLTAYPNADMASKVTLHNLLTHTGGTGDIFTPEFYTNRNILRDPSDYVDLFGSRPLAFQPGAQWSYSNYGFVLLGAVIEQVTGMTYDDYLAAHVHAPAGMTGTGAEPENTVVPDRAIGYTWQLDAGTLQSAAPLLPYRGTPAGGGYSTVGDFARFAVAIQEHRLLDPVWTELLLAGKVQTGSGGGQYAYGFGDFNVSGRRFVGHSGGYPGMNGDLMFEPSAGGYIVVVLSNLDPPAATQIMSFILPQLPGVATGPGGN